ncbi:Susd and RagB outer membrane lipoprotein [Lutibacter agarilyticus]|uniref:Susd and RagB outer membrane lipoprotein n=1 Tax=Lutibacter agarilyticus TaxID=1109740 RepID=A0A238WGE8_9FLAO|nr:SusD/RagB family nutrient-binding outer membrane lipoprotein [Lutibacter agarilyticus]SNR45580.1 Susd and RagB outer membrane lipoprotein [Lutibacter agarilyticus]SNR45645.1 Susd and RagB outer membrane lipoprotein [Lutibacter agarilyticus]
MKKTYNKIASLLLASIFILISCETDLDINNDPDLLSPDQVPMNSELPAAITGIGASAGSYLAIVGGFWSQYWTQSAVANQYKLIDDYTLPASSGIVNGTWSSMYDALTDVRNIKRIAKLNENWNYYLIATSLEVYASQILVDFYGEIPYSEANNTAILNPIFESGPVVYDLMVVDLKEALGKDLSASPIDDAPGNTDFIFGGDMNKWKQFANTLLLKVLLRQSEANSAYAQTQITSLINSGAMFLNSDAAITQFVDEASKSNPLFETDRRQLNVGTNLRASATLGSFLTVNNDPRQPLFYDGENYQLQGDFDEGSSTSSIVELSATDPVYFISLAESKFLQAEADVRYMGGNKAKDLYEEGVMAAFNQWELDGSSLVSGVYAYPAGSLEQNIEAIITQKWVSCFPGNGFEAFFEQNRTGYPKVSSVPQDDPSYNAGDFSYSVEGKTGGLFPKRLVFPQDERQRNSNAPAASSLTDNVWYDIN